MPACSNTADYSSDSSDMRILPFKFTLADDSVLFPEEGENQKFCYDVDATGSDTSVFADLSHFLLGICSSITFDDIDEITVSVNGDPVTVVIGRNVEIKTAEKPDNPTGCTGLKFDFSLGKTVGNTMHICISLNRVFPVGPVNVCLFGGNVTKTGLAICGPVCSAETGCTRTVYQREDICVPVTVRPFAEAGDASVTCCGTPTVSASPCPTSQGTTCTFTVRQSLCIEIPITFSAEVSAGTASVSCGTPSSEPCSCDESTSAAGRIIGYVD